MRIYDYLDEIRRALNAEESSGVPTPSWRIEEYLKDIYDAIRSGIYPSDEQVTEAVDGWLDDHPEATTTVTDGSITNAKLASSFVTPGTAAAYSSSATYAVGDYVFYDGALYRCTTAITTAETWTAAHWTAAVLGDDVGDLKSAFEYNKSYVDETIGTQEVDIDDPSDYDLHNGALGSAGNWSNINSNYQYVAIPIPQKGCHISWSVASGSPNLIVVGATEYTGAVDGQSYHKDSTFGRKSTNAGGSGSFDIPDDVKYILCNLVWGGNAVLLSSFAITKAQTTGTVDEDLAGLHKDVLYYGKNLFNPNDTNVVSGYISRTGVVYDNPTYKGTGYIKISNGKKITISPAVRQITVYNTSKEAVSDEFIDADSSVPYTMTPARDGYIRVTYWATDENKLMVEVGDTATLYTPYVAPYALNQNVLELNNRTQVIESKVNKPALNILILGDSYSANEVRYIDYLQAHMNIASLVNLGVSSAHLKDIYADRTEYPYDGRPYNGGTGNNNTFGNQIAKLERLMTGTDLDAGETQIYTSASQYPDIILIEGGKNDEVDASTDGYEGEMWEKVNAYSETSGGSSALMNTYLPIPYADTDRTNFAGAMHYLYGALHAKFENAKIFFITPSGINYSNANHTLYMVKADQMRAAARYLCTPTIDWDLEGRLSYVDNRVLGSGTENDPYTRNASSEYTVDSLHPNWKGGDLLGAVICAKLRMYGYIN